MGEGHVVRWDQNRTFWNKLHSPCLEGEEGWVQSLDHHPNREAWGWKHHGASLERGQDDCTVLRGGWMGCMYRKILSNNLLPSVRALKMGRLAAASFANASFRDEDTFVLSKIIFYSCLISNWASSFHILNIILNIIIIYQMLCQSSSVPEISMISGRSRSGNKATRKITSLWSG